MNWQDVLWKTAIGIMYATAAFWFWAFLTMLLRWDHAWPWQ